MASGLQLAGALLSVDRGDGTATRLTSKEADGNITISGSLDGFDRTMTFGRVGITQSPFLYSFLRSLRQVILTGYMGIAGSVANAVLFKGYTRQGSFDARSVIAPIECQGVGMTLANIKIVYSLAPKTLTDRETIFLDLKSKYSIPTDVVAGFFGASKGGNVFKGINVAGEVKLLDFLRDFLSPIGYRIFFGTDGKMRVFKIDPTAAAVATLKSTDILSMKVTPPAVNESNQIVAAAFCFDYVGTSGTYTTVTDVYDGVPYTPVAATQKQDHLTGVITNISPTVTPSSNSKRTVTTTNYSGGSITSQTVQEYTWYAPKACQNQQDASGVSSYNSSFDVYKFALNDWRTTDTETFRITRETRYTYTYSGTPSTQTSLEVQSDHYCALELPIKNRTVGNTETFYAGFIRPDGRSWWAGRELIAVDLPVLTYETRVKSNELTERVVYTQAADSDGVISSRTLAISLLARHVWGQAGGISTTTPTGVNAQVFGPTGGLRYVVNDDGTTTGWPGTATWGPHTNMLGATETITDHDATTYQDTVTLSTNGNSLIETYGGGSLNGGTCQMETVLAGTTFPALPRPILNYFWSARAPQAHSQTSNDAVRQALTTVTLQEAIQNDFCETDAELKTVAFEYGRIKAAFRVDFETLVDLDTYKEGDTIAISIPDLGGDAKKVVVWGIDRRFGANGEATQSVHALYFPPEIQTAA